MIAPLAASLTPAAPNEYVALVTACLLYTSTTRILELEARESDALLAFLFAQAGRPEFILRWHWRVDDIAFWDNRITQHYAVADYLPERRVMHRATVIGDRPR